MKFEPHILREAAEAVAMREELSHVLTAAIGVVVILLAVCVAGDLRVRRQLRRRP